MTTQVNFDSIGGGENTYATGIKQYSDRSGSGVTSTIKISCGFKPSIITWYINNYNNTSYMYQKAYYNKYDSANINYFYGTNGNTSDTMSRQVIGNTTSNPWWLNLQSVDDDGFTLGYIDYRDWTGLDLVWIAIP